MRIRVDPDLCEGYGLCEKLAPHLFKLGDTLPVTPPSTVDESLRPLLEQAVSRCPRCALTLED
jgi:ferredoxin